MPQWMDAEEAYECAKFAAQWNLDIMLAAEEKKMRREKAREREMKDRERRRERGQVWED